MKDIYLVLVNKKREIIKAVIFVTLILVYREVNNLIYNIINDLVGTAHSSYVSRLLFIAFSIVLFVYLRISFFHFHEKNWESLSLFGFSGYKAFCLFFLCKYDALFVFVYLSLPFYQLNQIRNGIPLVIHILNALLIFSLAIMSCVVYFPKIMKYLGYIVIGVLGILIATKKLAYQNVYSLIESNFAKEILFSECLLSFAIKIIIFLVIVCILLIMIKNKKIDVVLVDHHSKNKNLVGDLQHKLISKAYYFKDYLWINKYNKDYLMWKVFSTVLMVTVCYLCTSKMILFFFSYAICTVATFYLKDIYCLERDLLFYYFMSDYTYKQIHKDLSISGFLVIGDNVLITLLFSCFFQFDNFLVLFVIFMVVLFMSIFVNNHLLMRFPLNQYYFHLFWIILKFQIPILNCILLFRSIIVGNRNWEKMNYEQDGCANS